MQQQIQEFCVYFLQTETGQMRSHHICCIHCKPIFRRLHHDQAVFKFQGVATDYTYGSSAQCVALFLGLSLYTHINPLYSQKVGLLFEKKTKKNYFGNFAAFSFPHEKQNLIGEKEHWFGSVKKD